MNNNSINDLYMNCFNYINGFNNNQNNNKCYLENNYKFV